MKGIRSSTGRLSVPSAQQTVDVERDVSKQDVAASLHLPDKLRGLPSYARPTTCSRRRASAVAFDSVRASTTATPGVRPQSAKEAAGEGSIRTSAQFAKPTSQTAQPVSRTSSRKSIIATSTSKGLTSTSRSSPSISAHQASDRSAAPDQQSHSASRDTNSTATSRRTSRSSLPSTTKASAGCRATSASTKDTTAASRLGSRRQSAAAVLRPAEKAQELRITPNPASQGIKAQGSYARQQQMRTAPHPAAGNAAATAGVAIVTPPAAVGEAGPSSSTLKRGRGKVAISTPQPPVARSTRSTPKAPTAPAVAATAAAVMQSTAESGLESRTPAAAVPAVHASSSKRSDAASAEVAAAATTAQAPPLAAAAAGSFSPAGKFTMLVTPGGPDWPTAGLVPYSITPSAKTAARAPTATPEQQQQLAGSTVGLVPYSITPISKTASRAYAATPQQQGEGVITSGASRQNKGTSSSGGRKAHMPKSSKGSTGGYAAAAARRAVPGKLTASPGARPSCAAATSPAAPATVAAAAENAPAVPELEGSMSGLSIRDIELDMQASQAAELAASPESAAVGPVPNQLAFNPSQAIRQSSVAEEEAAAAAAMSAASAAVAEAKAAAEALEQELALEAARFAAEAAAQVQQQLLAQEAAAAAATLAAAAAAAAAAVVDDAELKTERCSVSPPAAHAAAGSVAGVGSSKYPVRPMRTPQASPLRARTPGRSPIAPEQHAELAAKMQDLELTFQQYKVTRDSSPSVRSSLRSSMTVKQQQHQLQDDGCYSQHRRSRSSTEPDTRHSSLSPGTFWELSPPAGVKTSLTAAGLQMFEPMVIAPAGGNAAAAAAAAGGDSAGQYAGVAAAVGMIAQYQELQGKWDAYKEGRARSPSPLRTSYNSRSSLSLNSVPTVVDGHLVPSGGGAADVIEGDGEESRVVAHDTAAAESSSKLQKLAVSATAVHDVQLQLQQQPAAKKAPAGTSSSGRGHPSSSNGRRKSAGAPAAAAAAAAGIKRTLNTNAAGSASYGAPSGAIYSAAASKPASSSSGRSGAPGTRRSSSSSKGLRASRRSSAGAATASAATAGFSAPALVPRSPEASSLAAAAGVEAVAATAEASTEPAGVWEAAVQWYAPSPDPCSPDSRRQQQQQDKQTGVEASQPFPQGGTAPPVAAAATPAAVNHPAARTPKSVVASSKATRSSSSPTAAILGSAAVAASPKLGVSPNSPAVPDGADMTEVAERLAAWSIAKQHCSLQQNGINASAAAPTHSVTTALGSATLCWMIPDSPGTVEGRPAAAAAAAVAQPAAADARQASWLAFNAAAAAAVPAAAAAAGAAVGAVAAPRFRLSGVGAAGELESVTFLAQPDSAGDAAGGSNSKGNIGKKGSRQGRSAAATPAGKTPRHQHKTPAATAASPAANDDVFYTPMQFTPGSTGKKPDGSRTAMTPKSAASAAAAAVAGPASYLKTDPNGSRVAESYYTPADGFTPAKTSAAADTNAESLAAAAVRGNSISSVDQVPAAPAAVVTDESDAICSSSKRQKLQQPAAAAAAAAGSTAAKEVHVSRQLLGLFEAAGEGEETPYELDQLSRKYSLLEQQQQLTPAAAAAFTAEGASPAASSLANGSPAASMQVAATPLPLPLATPVYQSTAATAAASSSSGKKTPAAAFLTAITPVMRCMGGFGSLSSRKLPHMGSGARRVPLAAAAALNAVSPPAAAAAAAGTAAKHSVLRRSARLAAVATPTVNQELGGIQAAAAASTPVFAGAAAVPGDAERDGSAVAATVASETAVTPDHSDASSSIASGQLVVVEGEAATAVEYTAGSYEAMAAAGAAEPAMWAVDSEDGEDLKFDDFGGFTDLDADGTAMAVDESYVTTRRRR